MRAASNSGPLIHLARVSALFLLKKLYGEVLIPYEVKIEVVLRGKEKGYSDAFIVERAISEGWIIVVDVKPPETYLSLASRAGVHMAESRVIWLAYREGLVALLDDDAARVFAESLGIKVRGSLGILIEAVKKGFMSKKNALRTLDKLSNVMYLSADLYRIVRKAIERM